MRYLPITSDDRRRMLEAIGADSIEDLYADVPAAARLEGLVDLPLAQGELEVRRALEAMAAKNLAAGEAPCFLGAGAYHHFVPAAVDHLVQRGEFLTAYTPYQPEISQGTLQVLFEFQTQVALLTGMAVANASMYDGATACAEAALMARRVTRRGRVILSGNLHPHYAATTRTMLKFLEGEVVSGPVTPRGEDLGELAGLIDDKTACVVVQNPDVFGNLADFGALAEAAHGAGALLVVAVAEVVSLGAIKPPGEMGADIVVGEGQSLGNGLNFGGPNLGLFATRQRYMRQMPGRLCGETVDADGRRGYVLTLSTREQHIRREKATSNICTNSGLCSLGFTIHMTLLGEDGFSRLAALNHTAAVTLADKLSGLAYVEVLNQTFFNEFTVALSKPASAVVDELAGRGILAGVPVSRLYPGEAPLENLLLLAATELNTEDEMDRLVAALEKVLS